jgi:L-asparaginase/Glu-tRNA(Gln) amidotransferase subunit D
MKHILMVLTGGTIGSTVNAGTIDTSNTAHSKLLHLFQQHDAHPEDLHFHCIEPIQILSENLAPCVWQTLIAAIDAQKLDHYDGIIITHGTDTLAYTANALSFYFHALKIPMLLVSSDYPLDDVRANGLSNFVCAVEFIRQYQTAGVFVPYRNQRQTMLLHKGTRLACSLQLGSDFFSVQNKTFMEFEDGQFKVCNPLLKSAHQSIMPLKAEFSSRILMIKPYPGLDYSY